MHTIVGGPPNSGKSTVTAALIKLCREQKRERGYNPTFGWSTLDVTDTSLPSMLDDSGSDSRDVTWSRERAEERKAMFAGRDEQLVLADSPGLIDEKTEIVVEPADSMILVVSDQRLDAVEEWATFAADNGLDHLVTLTTTLDDSVETGWTDKQSWEATIRSVHNAEFGCAGIAAYDDTTRRILKQLAKMLLRESTERESEER